MKPYYEDDWVTIYNGDCREILPTLPKVDLVLTDPPYNAINRQTGGLRKIDKGAADSAPVDVDVLAPLLWDAISGALYVWCSDEQYTAWMLCFKHLGGATRKCAWHKTNPSPMNGDKLWVSALELCVYAAKPRAHFSRPCGHPCWTGPTAPQEGHPTPKPIWLFSELVDASSPQGGTVLDPFMGSGTTLRAAKDLNRKAIGIEIEEKYCEIAARRMEQEVFDFTKKGAA